MWDEIIFDLEADRLGNMVAELFPFDEWGIMFDKENIDINWFPIFY